MTHNPSDGPFGTSNAPQHLPYGALMPNLQLNVPLHGLRGCGCAGACGSGSSTTACAECSGASFAGFGAPPGASQIVRPAASMRVSLPRWTRTRFRAQKRPAYQARSHVPRHLRPSPVGTRYATAGLGAYSDETVPSYWKWLAGGLALTLVGVVVTQQPRRRRR